MVSPLPRRSCSMAGRWVTQQQARTGRRVDECRATDEGSSHPRCVIKQAPRIDTSSVPYRTFKRLKRRRIFPAAPAPTVKAQLHLRCSAALVSSVCVFMSPFVCSLSLSLSFFLSLSTLAHMFSSLMTLADSCVNAGKAPELYQKRYKPKRLNTGKTSTISRPSFVHGLLLQKARG